MEIFKLLDFVFERFLRLLKLLDQSFSFFFNFLTVSNVPRKAAGVDETVMLPQNIRRDEDMLDGAVFCSEPRLVILQDLFPAQSSKNVFDHRSIDMEFGDVMADVFPAAITEEV